MNLLVEQHRTELEALCRRYGVRRLELFGSAATGLAQSGGSDLDFLVEFDLLPPGGYADAYFGLLESLEALYGRPVSRSFGTGSWLSHPKPFLPAIGRTQQNPALCSLKPRSIFTK